MHISEIRISQFSALFSYMLWHIDLKFAWLCFLSCKSDEVQISSLSVTFCRSYTPFGTENTWNTQFSAFFSYMLWQIELKFCIWLVCFTVPQIKLKCPHFESIFIHPSSGGTYYGMVMSVRISVRPSVWVSGLPFSALFSCMIWLIELKFWIWLCLNVLQVKFECCHFASIIERVVPRLNLEFWKYTVFRTFLLHALTYWAEILHVILLQCTYQVGMSSIFVYFCKSYAPFGT